MTEDRPGFPDEPDFDDPAYTPITELLASARAQTPIPADVAARLDATLAELGGRPQASEPSPVVVPLRQRSRLAPRLLAAAAVVAVVGVGAVGVAALQDRNSSSDSAAAGSATAADSGGTNAPEAAGPGTVPTPLNGLTDSVKGLRTTAGIPVLTTADFAPGNADLSYQASSPLEQVVRLAEKQYSADDRAPAPDSWVTPESGTSSSAGKGAGAAPGTDAPSAPTTARANELDGIAARARACDPPDIDGIATYPIVFDGTAALLVVHPESVGTRLVQAWSCDGSEVLASTTVPA